MGDHWYSCVVGQEEVASVSPRRFCKSSEPQIIDSRPPRTVESLDSRWALTPCWYYIIFLFAFYCFLSHFISPLLRRRHTCIYEVEMLAKETLAAKKIFHLSGEEDLVLQSVPLPSGVIGAPHHPSPMFKCFSSTFPTNVLWGFVSNTHSWCSVHMYICIHADMLVWVWI